MARLRWTPAVLRLHSALAERGVVAWRRGSTARLEIEDLDGLRPDAMSLILEALHPLAWADGCPPLRGWQSIVLLGRDYDGNRIDGLRYGHWLIWRTLWAVGLSEKQPPHRPDEIRLKAPYKRPRRRRKEKDVDEASRSTV